MYKTIMQLMAFSCVCTQPSSPPQRHKQATFNTIRRQRHRFYRSVNYVFYRGRGRVLAKFRIPGLGQARVNYFCKHRDRVGLTKFAYTRAGVEAGARSGAVAGTHYRQCCGRLLTNVFYFHLYNFFNLFI